MILRISPRNARCGDHNLDDSDSPSGAGNAGGYTAMVLFNDDQVAVLLGSHLLVGLTYLRPDGGIASRLEFHGTVESVGEDVVEVRRADNGEIFTLPPAPEAYEPAPPGEYRLKTTGEVVVDPDFTCVMTVHLAQNPVED
jgi:hypothetical protein